SIQARGIDPDVVLQPDPPARPTARSRYTEAMLPGHLRGDEEEEGAGAGDVLDGDGPIQAAPAELKKPAAPAPAPQREPARAGCLRPARRPAARARPRPAPAARCRRRSRPPAASRRVAAAARSPGRRRRRW